MNPRLVEPGFVVVCYTRTSPLVLVSRTTTRRRAGDDLSPYDTGTALDRSTQGGVP